MRMTIGLTSCNNHAEAWFTLQALRMYHDLADTEIVVVDNGNDQALKSYVEHWAHRDVRYVRHTESVGPAGAKNRVFAEARGEWVLVIDSHVLLAPGAVKRFRDWTEKNTACLSLLHGPLLYDDLHSTADAMNDEWRGGMWGTWRNASVPHDAEPYEIPMHGMGLFGCRRDAWLGFNPAFRGFGGEEGYIHTKYRQAGRQVLCLPFLRWSHYFRPAVAPYPVMVADRIHNYTVGLAELGIDSADMMDHFGIKAG
nr:glycosyltransferase [uncultured Rhodoferax sp.]